MTRLLITGAAGHVGSRLLAQRDISKYEVTACDIAPLSSVPDNVQFCEMDVRGGDVDKIVGKIIPDVIIHLASIVTPPKGSDRSFAYDVDVTGTKNIINAAVKYNTRRLIVTSSGAAYGYHADNPVPLAEEDAVRGNYEFPYSHHKRLVEEMLAHTRKSNPELEQVILRVGTVLGEGMENQITALFHKPRLLGITGNESPFVFIWDEDLAKILLRAAGEGPAGIYNVAGDGVLGLMDFAKILKKPTIKFPAWLLKTILFIAKPLGLSLYGPEQVRFLQYRPVLDNSRLKNTFGYIPEKTSREVFEFWCKQAGCLK